MWLNASKLLLDAAMDDIPWLSKEITDPDKWSKYAEKILQDVNTADILPDYGQILSMLKCLCPNSKHHNQSHSFSSFLLPCWFVDPELKYQFGILYVLKTSKQPPTKIDWQRFLRVDCEALDFFGQMGGQKMNKKASKLIVEGLDVSKKDTQIFLAMLDLANILRLWDWQLSTQEMLRFITSDWVLMEEKYGQNFDKPTCFVHPVLDLPMKVKQMRLFIQSLALDLINCSMEPASVLLERLTFLLGQAICPLWNLVRPWQEFVHANTFLKHFRVVFEFLVGEREYLELPSLEKSKFQLSPLYRVISHWKLSVEKSDRKCIKCHEKIAEFGLFLAAQSPAKCIYPREIIVNKPGESVVIEVVCSHQCHLDFGDAFKLLTWTDRLMNPKDDAKKVETNAAMFYQSAIKPKQAYPALALQSFLAKADWTVPLVNQVHSVFSMPFFNSQMHNLTKRQEKSKPLVLKLLKDNVDYINGVFSTERKDLRALQDQLSYFDEKTTISKDLGSMRCYWQRSWLPVGVFAKQNVDDVLVVSHFVRDDPNHPMKRERAQEILELLVLEREFLVLPITSDCIESRDVKLGVHFQLRRPKYRNNFSPESLKSGTCYTFARRLDSKTRNCVGGFLIPSVRNANSWIGILMPDMFDRVTRIPRLDATVQRLVSFQKSNFEVHKIAKASIFISNNSIRREETNNVKKTVFYVMGLMLHRSAFENGLAPKLDITGKMIPFKLILANENSIDCTIVLNFVLISGNQFLPIIHHICQKLDWVHRVDFIIDKDMEGAVPKEHFVSDELLGNPKFPGFKIETKYMGLSDDSHLPRVNIIWTKKTKLVFDGELLVYRMHIFAPLRATFRAIVPHDFLLGDILELGYFNAPTMAKRWHFFYLGAGGKPFEMLGLEYLTIGEIARTVGHIGCHFYMYITDDVDDVLIDEHFPPLPYPLFSRSHHNHSLQAKNHLVLMWSGSLALPMDDNNKVFEIGAWIVHENGRFEDPKHWQTLFKSLSNRTMAYKVELTESFAQDLTQNSTSFPLIIGPMWRSDRSDREHVAFIDTFGQTFRAIFGRKLEDQIALLVPIPGKELQTGIIFRDEIGLSCRFYVHKGPTWVQNRFGTINTSTSWPLKNNEAVPRVLSFKPNEKSYVLGSFKVVFSVPSDCDVPIYMMVRTLNPDVSSKRLNMTDACDKFAGSHYLVPIFPETAVFRPATLHVLTFILGSSVAATQARFNLEVVYCDVLMPVSYELSYFAAFFLFHGSYRELKKLVKERNFDQIASKSLIAKKEAPSKPVTIFLLPLEMMKTIVPIVEPLVLSSSSPCECYRTTQEVDRFMNAQKTEASLFWDHFDEREQLRPCIKRTAAGKANLKVKSQKDSLYPGMHKLFEEEKSNSIFNESLKKNDGTSCSLTQIYQAQKLARGLPPTPSPSNRKTNADTEIHKEKVSIDSNKKCVGNETPSLQPATGKAQKQDPGTEVEETELTLGKENGEQGVPGSPFDDHSQSLWSSSWKPLNSIFTKTVSQDKRNQMLESIINLAWKEAVEKEEPLRVCDNCGREGFEMKVCDACKASFFCSTKCFKKAQRAHKDLCCQILHSRFTLAMEPLKQPTLPKL